jgi:hypothetical protein
VLVKPAERSPAIVCGAVYPAEHRYRQHATAPPGAWEDGLGCEYETVLAA